MIKMFKTMLSYTIAFFLVVTTSMKCDTGSHTTNTTNTSDPDSTFMTTGDTARREPVKLALLVGINDYKSASISDLEGCVNDVEGMKAMLIGKFGFLEDNIVMLKNEEATHKNIIDAIQQKLIDRAQKGDIVVFHYSGHGSQMSDASNGDETDGLDETIVPYDSRQENIFDISDDVMNGLLSKLSKKTRNITWILDSCHSGTGLKGMDPIPAGAIRMIPADTRVPPPDPEYALSARGTHQGDNDIRLADIDYTLISGCLSKQNSFEHRANGEEHGALTYFLLQELNKAGSGVTYRDVMDAVKNKVQTIYPNQCPQLEGTSLDNYVFSDSTSMAQSYVLVSPLTTKTVKLFAGKAHGLTKGSVFYVYSPGSKEMQDSTKSIARIVLTEVNPFESTGTISKGTVAQSHSRAVESRHHYPDLKFNVYYKNLASSSTLRSVKDQLKNNNFIVPTMGADGFQLLLEERNGKIVFEGPEANPLSNPVSVSADHATEVIVEKVLNWARWFNLLGVENVGSTTLGRLTLIDKNEPSDIGLSIQVSSGNEYKMRVQNTSAKDVYLSVLDICTDGSIAVLYPFEPGAKELLRAGEEVEKTLVTSLPDGCDAITDIIKVFLTSSAVDFYTLTQGPIKGDPVVSPSDDPLTLLLQQATLDITRGSSVVGVNEGTWQTLQGTVGIKR